MFSRLLGVPVLLAAAVGVPYVATHGPNLDGLWDNNPGTKGSAQANGQVSANGALPPQWPASPQGPGTPVYSTTTPLEGIRSMSLHDIFRFDVSKEWVYQRWARKSTALAELGLYGIRVPLVSGTELHDLAGSLTYYFDSEGRAQRITFHGNTGDTTGLVMLLARRYHLARQATPIAGEQLFQIRRGTQVFSELRTRPAPVLWANSPHDSFAVELELQRSGSTTPLAPPQQLLPVAQSQAAAVAPQPSQVAQQAPANPPQEGISEKGEKKSWKAFFPRSRVPKGQVESLERRGRFW